MRGTEGLTKREIERLEIHSSSRGCSYIKYPCGEKDTKKCVRTKTQGVRGGVGVLGVEGRRDQQSHLSTRRAVWVKQGKCRKKWVCHVCVRALCLAPPLFHALLLLSGTRDTLR